MVMLVDLKTAVLEAEGGSCWWYKVDSELGVKVMKQPGRLPRALREAGIGLLAAGLGFGPKISGVQLFKIDGCVHAGIVMERIEGEPGYLFERRAPDEYHKLVGEAIERLHYEAGLDMIDVSPKNVIFDSGVPVFLDYGPVGGVWPRVLYDE